MPIVNVPIPEVDRMVSRPIVMAILEQIKSITHIPNDVDIVYIGQNNERHNLNHTTDKDKAPVKLAGDHLISVEVEEEPDEGMFATTAGNIVEHAPDFVDKNLGVILKPIYNGLDITMRVTFRTPSRAEAIRWRNDARFKASQMRTVNLHEVEYQYQLPPVAMVLLNHIYSLRERQHGYNEDFITYLNSHLTTRGCTVTNVVGKHPEIVIKEQGLRIQGEFDFKAKPQQQDKNEGNGWEVSFTYTYSVHQPVEYSITYPILVHQQTIDARFIPQLPKSPEEVAKRMPNSIGAMYHMEAPVIHARMFPRDKIYYSPEQDIWIPATVPSHHRVVASFMVGVKDLPTQKLLNLRELGDYVLDPDILDWMLLAENRRLRELGVAPVGIYIYRNESLISPQQVDIKLNGDVVLLSPADCRKRYRVVIAVTRSLRSCTQDSLQRLMQFPEALCKLMKITMTSTGTIHDLLTLVDMREFSSCAYQAGTSLEDGINQIVFPKTVMTAQVQAWRASELN